MAAALTLLLALQLAGEVLVRLLEAPIPGPVAGMVLLFSWLVLRGAVPENLRHISQGLLDHLALLFVPAGVGVMVHAERIRQEWPAILLALLLSTWLALGATALVMKALMGRQGRQND